MPVGPITPLRVVTPLALPPCVGAASTRNSVTNALHSRIRKKLLKTVGAARERGVNVLNRLFSDHLLFRLSRSLAESVAEGFDVLAVSVPGLTQDVSVSGRSRWRLAQGVTTGTHESFWMETQLLSGHSVMHVALSRCCVGVRKVRSCSALCSTIPSCLGSSFRVVHS